MATAEPITASLTRARLQADRCRLQAHLAQNAHATSLSLWLTPSYQAVYLHRWSHYHYLRGHRLLARALWHLNLLLTGADISPLTDIEGGLLIVHPLANIMLGRAGRNLTAGNHGPVVEIVREARLSRPRRGLSPASAAGSRRAARAPPAW